jgi:hypothetical protein
MSRIAIALRPLGSLIEWPLVQIIGILFGKEIER